MKEGKRNASLKTWMAMLLSLVSMMTAVTGCVQRKEAPVSLQTVAQDDSLKQVIADREEQINSMMATLNEIQEGFNQISEAENRVSLIQDDERTDKAADIKEDIQLIADRMQLNRELIKKLQNQLKESDFKSAEFKRVIANMVKQLEAKDQQLQQLRAELDAKNIHIAELDQAITDLNTNVSDLKADNDMKLETINTQDLQLNTAWYVFGTKSELREQRILTDGKVLQSAFNKSYFTKIDIRVTNDIKLYSKSAKLLTPHPSSSYELVKDNNQQYELRITNPQVFWSTSKYLVILVK